MQACVSDKIYTTANTFKLGVKENKQQLHPVTGELTPYYKHWQSTGKRLASPDPSLWGRVGSSEHTN